MHLGVEKMDVSEDIKFGICPNLYPLDVIYESATYADKNGFDSVMMGDHLIAIGIKRFDALEAWSTLTALALKTKRVKLGTCVTDPHRRPPAVLAQTVATLDIVSNGRAILGIGPGEAMNLDPYGVAWKRPVSRMHESLKIIKSLWTQDMTSYNGDFFNLQEAIFEPKPIQEPHPPIWIAANSPRTMKITGELADGWFPLNISPKAYKEKLTFIGKHAKEAERSPEDIEPALFMYTLVAPTYDEAVQRFELPAKMLLAFFPRLLKEKFGYTLPNEKFNAAKFIVTPSNVKELLNQVKDIPLEAVEEFFVFGSPDDCTEGIEKFIKAGTRHFALALLVPPQKLMPTLKMYHKKVISYFKDSTSSSISSIP
jgi:alkanesulfonate monooxygenase SsuD/methylene tetrahydromethanopterin reductase-like flavin-dependent oxidoreductase (luciferase family)